MQEPKYVIFLMYKTFQQVIIQLIFLQFMLQSNQVKMAKMGC